MRPYSKFQDLLDENEEILSGRDRKQKNRLFQSIRDGAFIDTSGLSPARKCMKRGSLCITKCFESRSEEG